MRVRNSFIGMAALLAVAFAAQAETGLLDETDRLVDQSVLGLVAAQGDILSAVEPAGGTCSANGGPSDAPENTDVGVYSCEFAPDPEPSASPSATPSPAPTSAASPIVPSYLPSRKEIQSLFGRLPGSLVVGVTTSNDNYPGRLQQRGPSDVAFDAGHTFDLKLNTVKVFGKDSKFGKRGDAIGIEVGTELYSHPTQVKTDAYYGMLQAQVNQNETGLPVMLPGPNGTSRPVYLNRVTLNDPIGAGQLRQQSLDRQYLTAFKEWNREKFTIIGEVTVEKRNTTGKSLGNSIQNGWHRMGGASYTFRDENAKGSPGSWNAVTVGNTGGGTAFNGDPIPAIDVVDVSVTPDVPEDPAILQYGSWAGSVGGTIQKTKRVFRGTCELQTNLSAHLGVQGNGTKLEFDRNSRVQVGSEIGASLVRNNKWNDSRLSVKGGAALIYFPRPTSVGNMGWNAKTEMQGNFHTGSSGNMLQTSIQFTARGLAGMFQEIDDNDPIFKLSVRYVFAGKRRK